MMQPFEPCSDTFTEQAQYLRNACENRMTKGHLA